MHWEAKMVLTLKRIAKKPNYTIGKLYIDGAYFCDTLEDTDRGLTCNMPLEQIQKIKVKDKTAIPTGMYYIDMKTVSPKYSNYSRYPWAKPYNAKIPRLQNVPGYLGVLIHPGNTADHTSGCILVGQNKEVGKVLNSQITWKKLMERLVKDQNIVLIVK